MYPTYYWPLQSIKISSFAMNTGSYILFGAVLYPKYHTATKYEDIH
jgi:hypothetical protein